MHTSVHASVHTWMHSSAIKPRPILTGGTVGLWGCVTVRPSFWSVSGTVGQRDSETRRVLDLVDPAFHLTSSPRPLASLPPSPRSSPSSRQASSCWSLCPGSEAGHLDEISKFSGQVRSQTACRYISLLCGPAQCQIHPLLSGAGGKHGGGPRPRPACTESDGPGGWERNCSCSCGWVVVCTPCLLLRHRTVCRPASQLAS